MSIDETDLLERGLLRWVAEDVLARRLRRVPEGERAAVLRQAREELGHVLCSAPILGDPVRDVMMRAEIAVAFGVTHAGSALC